MKLSKKFNHRNLNDMSRLELRNCKFDKNRFLQQVQKI